MSTYHLRMAQKLKGDGSRLGRKGMSERVISAVAEFEANGRSYQGAIYLAGRLKAIAAMTASDEYWREKMEDGFSREARTAVPTISNAEEAA